ncbi:hypothetical protein tb265_42770 [Gemmatimonadetes bacterium T265]|nr:hypothetical protein tb265_42770 [Gemmatimonadetes bacterium T265]
MWRAIAATGAVTGSVHGRDGDGGTAFVPLARAEHGGEHAGSVQILATRGTEKRSRAATAADALGVMRRVADGEPVVYPVADVAAWFPALHRYYVRQGARVVGHFPLRVAGTVTGYLGLSWRTAEPPNARVFETACALAVQASLALEMQRRADEARVAAVAAERQAAAAALADEHARLAREVHDTLAQGLAGIVMQLGAARAKLGPAYAAAAPQLDLVDGLARDTLAVARRTITVLRPGAPGHEDLEAGLRRVVAECGRARAGRVTLAASGVAPAALPRRASAEVEYELLRIAQAALANAVQHARAAHVAVTLDYGPDHPPERSAVVAPALQLAVADDGVGFDPATPRPGRFGLVGMRERAARVGAALTLVTAPGEETEVVVVWPGPPAAPGGAP